MPRPHRCRCVGVSPAAKAFKPLGVPANRLEGIELRLDELEAIRLADFEGLYHEEAAHGMGISRATLGRLVEAARHKVADALINGKMLVIKGGVIAMSDARTFVCRDCSHQFQVPYGTGRPARCPSCSGTNFGRAAKQRGQGGAGQVRRECRRVHRRQRGELERPGHKPIRL